MIDAVAGCSEAIFLVVIGMAGDLLVGVDLLDVVESWFRGRGRVVRDVCGARLVLARVYGCQGDRSDGVGPLTGTVAVVTHRVFHACLRFDLRRGTKEPDYSSISRLGGALMQGMQTSRASLYPSNYILVDLIPRLSLRGIRSSQRDGLHGSLTIL
jgi:hypothetical protein